MRETELRGVEEGGWSGSWVRCFSLFFFFFARAPLNSSSFPPVHVNLINITRKEFGFDALSDSNLKLDCIWKCKRLFYN